jgi:ketosteroid isomerase-like protein
MRTDFNLERFPMRRLWLVLVTMNLLGVAMADDSKQPLSGEIQAWLDVYAVAYNRQDYAALLQMWDRDDPEVIYMAEEIDPPMHGWGKLNAYFNPKPGVQVLDGIRNRYSEVRARYLAPDLALATYKLEFDIKVKSMKPMRSWDRVMAVFRRKDGQWKMVAYGEAPMAPLTMVRRMLQEAVPEDFDDFLQQQKK